MSNFKTIQIKLESFIKRYYINELLKGAILFFAIGLLYFLFTLFIEHILWLGTVLRALLFWLFVIVELALLIKFICIPSAKLFKLQKGIDYEEASTIIGQHFPEVNDKLLNVLQLSRSKAQSELLLASIEQKSEELSPIPFMLAINLKRNIKYLKYAAIPVLIILTSFVSGHYNWFSDSYNRVVHYKMAYEPPAPFQFFVVNSNLNTVEGKDFKLLVQTVGDVTPENAQIVYNNEAYYLQQTNIGEFEYVFSQPKQPIEFNLVSNAVKSKPYYLNIVEAPTLLGFEMVLNYPRYVKKENDILKGTGNAIIPEGTTVTWNLKTKSTDQIHLYSRDTINFVQKKNAIFSAFKRLSQNFEYSISTSNKNLENYENLAFSINVVKDEYPELNVKVETDTIDKQTLYFYGQVSDDYGFTKLQLVYYPANDENDKQFYKIPIASSNIADFFSAFPNNLKVRDGITYDMYFQIFDNDEVNKYKSSKSSIFSYRKRTAEEEKEKKLTEQSETIQDLNKSLQKFDEQDKKLDELKQSQKEKSTLNFSDKKKLESFFKRQEQQDEMMMNFNKRLQDNLEEFQNENKKDDAFKDDLKERLKENEEQLKKDEKLLEELKKLTDKINNEELNLKLEELSKQNKNQKRSLEQLLELTKRFYVEKKLDKLKEDLMKLSKDQEKLSNESQEKNTQENQDKLNKEFDDFKDKMDKLKQDNKALQKPFDIPIDKLDEKEVDDEQKKASEELKKNESENASDKQEDKPKENQNLKNAKSNQKKAAKKMKQMSQKIGDAMQMSGGEQMQEDMEMLRQVLDNLVLFSLDQEKLMNQFKSIDINHNKYATYLRKQNNLKENFEHIDDSLFALSLRQPKLSEKVNKEITEVYFNIDKSLSQFAESQLYQGISNQQFAITATNNLADFLSDVLDGMQESMNMAPGKGGKGDMQLPDIIMSQEELNKMMEQGLKQSQEGMPKEGEGKKDGEGKKEGNKGKEKGDKEGEGKSGQSGNGNQDGFNDNQNGELYKIYQEQQQLREALEKRLEKEGKGAAGDRLLKQMEDVELELLNKGFTNQTLQKMLQLKHQLLKLDNAAFQQGEENKRESETNKDSFNNTTNNQIPTAKEYFKTTEILNKQTLPLQQIYRKKVQEYFKKEE